MTDPQEIMEQWAAGDWDKDPDGGTCTAILKAYNAGLEAAAREADKRCEDEGYSCPLPEFDRGWVRAAWVIRESIRKLKVTE